MMDGLSRFSRSLRPGRDGADGEFRRLYEAASSRGGHAAGILGVQARGGGSSRERPGISDFAPSSLRPSGEAAEPAKQALPAPSKRPRAGSQLLSAGAFAGLSVAAVLAGLDLLDMGGWWAAGAGATLASAAILACVSLGSLSLGLRLGTAMSDHLDARTEGGDFDRLFRPEGWWRILWTPAGEEVLGTLPPHARRALSGPQPGSHPRYLLDEILFASRAVRGAAGLCREMLFGQPEMAPFLRPYRWSLHLAKALLGVIDDIGLA